MANRVFQSVIYQMKDAINRVVGVVDETGAVISCSELNLIGEVRDGFVAERLTAGDRFVRDGYTYQQFSSAKHNDYAVFVEGADETAGQFAAVLSISLQSIKQYHDEKFDKSNFIKNVVLDNILPGDIYAKARELHFATDVSRVVFIVRVTSGGDISAYDVVSSLFPDKQKDFVFNISETDTVLVKEIRKGIDRTTVCEMFLREVFKQGSIESLDQETLFTIQRFFENNLNVSETSRGLFVHRNTLVYRLEKIKKLTGLDLREFDDAIVFKVALMVKKYLSNNPAKY